MLAIIFCKRASNIAEMRRNLSSQRIMVERAVYDPFRGLPERIFEANVAIIAEDAADGLFTRIIPELRRLKRSLPIVVLSEKDHPAISERARELGADAHFAKPVEYHLFGLNLKQLACKKEEQMNGARWMRAFDIWLDIENHRVKRNRKIIPLRNKEFALLEYFIINRGKVLTRNSILEHVWDRNANFASNTVDVHINRLRRKIDDFSGEKLIHTIHCIGYVFDKKGKQQRQ